MQERYQLQTLALKKIQMHRKPVHHQPQQTAQHNLPMRQSQLLKELQDTQTALLQTLEILDPPRTKVRQRVIVLVPGHSRM
jgi:hypothetical protein